MQLQVLADNKVVIGVAALFFILSSILVINSNQLLSEIKTGVVNQLEKVLETELKVGSINLVGLNQLKINQIQMKGDYNTDLLQARSITIHYSWQDLLFNYLKPLDSIAKISLVGPEINLVKQEQWNYQSLQDKFIEPDNSSSTSESSDLDLTIEIKQGQVDYQSNKLKEKVDKLEGSLEVNNNLEVDLIARIASLNNSKLKLIGSIKDKNYQGKLEFSQLDLAKVGKRFDFNLADLNYQGQLDGNISFKGKLGAVPNYYGDLQLKDANLSYQDKKLNDISGYFSLNEYGLKVKRLFARFKKAPLLFQGEVFSWQKPQFNLNYQVPQLQLAKLNSFLPSELQLTGLANINGQLRGSLQDPNLTAELKLTTGKINQVEVSDLTSKLYYQNSALNLKKLNFNYGTGQFTGDGMLTFGEEFNYILSAQFSDLDLAKLKREFGLSLSLSGQAEGDAIISGTSFKWDQLNALGSLSIGQGKISNYNFDQFDGNFWLSQSQLFLNQAQLKSGKSMFKLGGMIDLAGELDLTLEADKLKLEQLNSLHNLDKLSGELSLDGKLTGNISDPKFTGRFGLQNLVLADPMDLSINQATGKLSYNNQIIKLQSVNIPRLNSQLQGKIDLASNDSKLVINTQQVEAAKLLANLGIDLPVTGAASGRTEIKQLLTDPVIKGQTFVKSGQAFDQHFDRAKLDFGFQQGEFRIYNLQAAYQDSTAQASGTFVDERLDLSFNSQNLSLQDLDHLTRLGAIRGKAKARGRVYGKVSDLKVSATVDSQEVKVNQYQIGQIDAKLDYDDAKLSVLDGQLNQVGNSYDFRGGINLHQQEFDDFIVDIKQGNLFYLNQILPIQIREDYQLTGRIEANGSVRQPKFKTDLSISDIDQKGNLQLNGDYWFGNGVDLSLVAQQFNLDFLNRFNLLPYQIAGQLDLTGKLTGELDSLDFDSNLKITQGQVAGLDYEELSGRAKVIDSQKLILNQELEVKGNSTLQADGVIPLNNSQKFGLNLKMKKGNLSLLSFWLDDVKLARGQGSAQLNLGGTWQNPRLTGAAKLVSASFAHPVLDRKIQDLTGDILFKDERVVVDNLTGHYGEGNFNLQGDIALNDLMPINYDLKFQGQDIAFEHGSWQGLNDAKLEVTGSLQEPLVSGEIKAHNMNFNLPFKWPRDNSNQEPFIKPRFDLQVKPGEKVKVRNDNIDVLVQGGELNLKTVNDKLELTGRLKSTTGRFTYYNTEFELQEGRAVFNKYSYIPNLQIQAQTKVQDTTINLDLTGLADRLKFSLSSDPELTKKEIITLLTKQGGIGNLLEKNYEQAVKDELWRIVGEGFKTELIYKVERSFEESLNLDQVRIKSLLSDKLEIEIGKFIFDNFMLKYNRSFGIEEKQAVGFEYNFSQGLDNLQLRGSYDSQGDYKLGVEVTVPF
ncbi:hypothetical protein JCM16358_13480 [Halanaerocella petrolearia]